LVDEADWPAPKPLEGYAFESFRIDLTHRQLFRDDEPLPIGLKVYDTLVLLIRHRDRVVGKDEIISSVWPDSFVSEDSLTQSVSALRRVLLDDPAQPKFIATIARRGYRFIGAVAELRAAASTTTEGVAAVADRAPGVLPTLPVPVARSPGAPQRWVWPAAVLAAAVALATAWLRLAASSSAPTPSAGPLHFTLDLPGGVTLASGGLLSPDSRYLVFVAQDAESGKTQLWLRSLDAADSRALEGTEGASRPFWSPDSQAIGFFADTKLKRVGVTSGLPPQTLAPTVGARPLGGTWNRNGLILYSDSGSLSSITAVGGPSTVVREPDAPAQEVSLRTPQFLPDGRHFLYAVGSPNLEKTGTYVGALDSGEKVRVFGASESSVTFVPPAYLVFVRDRALMAQPFDLSTLALSGDARTVSGKVSANPVISASGAGLLSYGGGTTAERLLWFSRSGEQQGVVTVPTVLHNLALSPDQKQLLGTSGDPDQNGIWLAELDRGTATRLIPSAGPARWSADGTRVVFSAANYSGAGGIHARSVVDGPDDQLWLDTADPKVVNDWSSDGRFVVYISGNLQTKNDIWLLPRFGERAPIPFLKTAANEIQAQVSPDGRWIAYASDESGTMEAYVQSFPVPGAKRKVSVSGGSEPQWRRDGRELFYISPDHMMMAVAVVSGGSLHVGRPQALFRAPIIGSLSDFLNYYTVTADGQRFLVDSVATENASPEPITVLVNWTELVR
jgi:DNA-binding winged helix-turn-helix (wHTH) protein/Tol biopolymer transport system component